MQLSDGLIQYKYQQTYNNYIELELIAQNILLLLEKYGDNPDRSAITEAKDFLVEVEKWKAGCLQQRIGNAVQNSEIEIWQAFQMAVKATNNIDKIRFIMQLKGFGSSVDEETGQRRAKVATSVLRFLWPEKWGVVDWQVTIMLGLLIKNDWDVDNAIMEARTQKAKEIRDLYNLIDEQAACATNEQYREISQNNASILPRAADVDMALFGLSLVVWPIP